MDNNAHQKTLVAQGPDKWLAWLAEHDRLNAEILARRKQVPIPVDELWTAARADREARDAAISLR